MQQCPDISAQNFEILEEKLKSAMCDLTKWMDSLPQIVTVSDNVYSRRSRSSAVRHSLRLSKIEHSRKFNISSVPMHEAVFSNLEPYIVPIGGYKPVPNQARRKKQIQDHSHSCSSRSSTRECSSGDSRASTSTSTPVQMKEISIILDKLPSQKCDSLARGIIDSLERNHDSDATTDNDYAMMENDDPEDDKFDLTRLSSCSSLMKEVGDLPLSWESWHEKVRLHDHELVSLPSTPEAQDGGNEGISDEDRVIKSRSESPSLLDCRREDVILRDGVDVKAAGASFSDVFDNRSMETNTKIVTLQPVSTYSKSPGVFEDDPIVISSSSGGRLVSTSPSDAPLTPCDAQSVPSSTTEGDVASLRSNSNSLPPMLSDEPPPLVHSDSRSGTPVFCEDDQPDPVCQVGEQPPLPHSKDSTPSPVHPKDDLVVSVGTKEGPSAPVSTKGGLLPSLYVEEGPSTPMSTEEGRPSAVSTEEGRPSPVSTEEGRPSAVSTEEGRPSAVSTEEERPSPVSTEEGRPSAVSTEEGRPSPVSTEEGRPSPVSTEEGRPSAVSTEEGRPSAVSTEEGRPSPVSTEEGRPSPVSTEEGRPSAVSMEEGPSRDEGPSIHKHLPEGPPSPVRAKEGPSTPVCVKEVSLKPESLEQSSVAPLSRDHSVDCRITGPVIDLDQLSPPCCDSEIRCVDSPGELEEDDRLSPKCIVSPLIDSSDFFTADSEEFVSDIASPLKNLRDCAVSSPLSPTNFCDPITTLDLTHNSQSNQGSTTHDQDHDFTLFSYKFDSTTESAIPSSNELSYVSEDNNTTTKDDTSKEVTKCKPDRDLPMEKNGLPVNDTSTEHGEQQGERGDEGDLTSCALSLVKDQICAKSKLEGFDSSGNLTCTPSQSTRFNSSQGSLQRKSLKLLRKRRLNSSVSSLSSPRSDLDEEIARISSSEASGKCQRLLMFDNDMSLETGEMDRDPVALNRSKVSKGSIDFDQQSLQGEWKDSRWRLEQKASLSRMEEKCDILDETGIPEIPQEIDKSEIRTEQLEPMVQGEPDEPMITGELDEPTFLGELDEPDEISILDKLDKMPTTGEPDETSVPSASKDACDVSVGNEKPPITSPYLTDGPPGIGVKEEFSSFSDHTYSLTTPTNHNTNGGHGTSQSTKQGAVCTIDTLGTHIHVCTSTLHKHAHKMCMCTHSTHVVPHAHAYVHTQCIFMSVFILTSFLSVHLSRC